MVKFPPGGRARGPGGRFRGPEAEPAVGPLIAQLKQDRADIAKAKRKAEAAAARKADERVVQVITAFTEYVSKAIIDANNAMKTSHSEMLLVQDMYSLPGSKLEPGSRIGIDHKRILTGIRTWASKNGISIQVKKIGHDGPGEVRAYCIGAGLQWERSSLDRAMHGGKVGGHPKWEGRNQNETVIAFEKRLESNRAGWRLLSITFSWEAELEAE